MNFSDLQQAFHRALAYTLSWTKWKCTFVTLAFCGMLVVFCKALAVGADHWVAMSLTFLPIFLCSGVLLALGIILIRIYHDERKHGEVELFQVVQKSWELMWGATYFTLPFVLAYLFLWMVLGLFLLLRGLPFVGDLVAVVLSFAPFLLNLAALLLVGLVACLLFFAAPVLAFKGLHRHEVVQTVAKRLQKDLFSSCLLFLVALLPFIVYLGFLLGAALLAGSECALCGNALQVALQWFFIMIPFCALLAPAVIFFFQFSAEAHLLAKRA